MDLSYSQVSSLMQCPAKWAYEKQLGMRGPVSSEMYLGSAFHAACAGFYMAKLAGQTLDLPSFQELFVASFESGQPAIDTEGNKRSVLWHSSRDACMQQGLDMVAAYHPTARATEPMQVEQLLERQVGQHKIVGRVDLVLADGDLVDIKTSSRALWQTDLDASLQPTFYALLIGGPTDFHYHDIIKNKVPTVAKYRTHRRQRDIAWLRDAIPMFAELAAKGPWVPCRSNLCKYCAYTDLCLEGEGLGLLAQHYAFGGVVANDG